MNSFKTDKEIQDKINKNMRLISYKIFYTKGDFKFVQAFDKLKSRVLLDHKIHINNRIKDSLDKDITLFDVLYGNELDLVLQSSVNLLKLYEDVMDRKIS